MTTSLSDRLAAVGRHYGDAVGYIPIHTKNDGVKYVATADGQDPFVVYNVGDKVANDATLAVCGINAAGELAGCDPAYGATVLYALEDLQSSRLDPSDRTAECHVLFGTTGHCKIRRLDGSASCYVCSGGSCAKTHC
ncbi:hypothetical protein [Polyangium jinanense]|uniref:Uncharacterized protein n=1 Tax=Polyangium jinanense TaxID=2829994 RepID=A0A9X4ASY2_9BACT|nr:hypothetical protein [Polyangium jinanense]MDC3955319.1 hypothetical protein [Polyangium jinanense]MDC3981620.1 hypothetical protein [Polyangium jinanense]